MNKQIRLVKIQIAAEFVLDDGQILEPGVYGPIEMTPAEFEGFDLQSVLEREVEKPKKRSRRKANRT